MHEEEGQRENVLPRRCSWKGAPKMLPRMCSQECVPKKPRFDLILEVHSAKEKPIKCSALRQGNQPLCPNIEKSFLQTDSVWCWCCCNAPFFAPSCMREEQALSWVTLINAEEIYMPPIKGKLGRTYQHIVWLSTYFISRILKLTYI